MRFVHAAVGVGLLFALHAGRVGAQGRDAGAADALFREARALLKAGDFKAACPKLAESHRLDPAAGTAINLGDCWGKLGKLADALQSYRDALDLLKPGDHRIGPSKEQIASLEKRVPKLTVELAPGAPDGTRVKRDDVELGEASLGVALPVNPGEHWVVVVAPGRSDSRTKLKLAGGASRTVVVEAGARRESHLAAQAEPDATPATPGAAGAGPSSTQLEDSGSSQRTWGWVAVGSGAVALLAAGYLSYQAGQNAADADDLCPKSTCADKEKYDSLRGDERSNLAYANISLAIGLIAAAGGATLILTAPTGAMQPAANARSSPQYALHLRGVW